MAESADDLDVLLAYLRDVRRFDFTGYKPASLERRLRRRMDAIGVTTYEDYRDHLEVHPEEFPYLFNTIMINVTSFFRDPEAWETLASKVLPELLAAKPDDEPIRVWSAGCASGEETYSIAIVLAAMLGEEAFLQRVKIYGPDVDDEALDHARAATTSSRRFPRRSRTAGSSGRATPGASARTCVARSSSGATTSSRTRPSRASTCCCAATP